MKITITIMETSILSNRSKRLRVANSDWSMEAEETEIETEGKRSKMKRRERARTSIKKAKWK